MSSVGHLAASGIVSSAVRFARCYHLRVCICVCMYYVCLMCVCAHASMRECMRVSSISSV